MLMFITYLYSSLSRLAESWVSSKHKVLFSLNGDNSCYSWPCSFYSHFIALAKTSDSLLASFLMQSYLTWWMWRFMKKLATVGSLRMNNDQQLIQANKYKVFPAGPAYPCVSTLQPRCEHITLYTSIPPNINEYYLTHLSSLLRLLFVVYYTAFYCIYKRFVLVRT